MATSRTFTTAAGITFKYNGKSYYAKVIDGKNVVISKEEFLAAEEENKQTPAKDKREQAIARIESEVVEAFNRFTATVKGIDADATTKDKREANRPHTFMSFQYNGKALFEICWSSKGVRVIGKTKLFGDRAPKGSKVINNGSLDLYIPTFKDNITDTIYEYATICAGIEG